MSAYPGAYTVPGTIQPGSAWPGDTLSPSADQWLLFTGNQTLTYPQYLDMHTQRTLVAAPGNEYDVTVASGQAGAASVPTDGRWIPEGS